MLDNLKEPIPAKKKVKFDIDGGEENETQPPSSDKDIIPHHHDTGMCGVLCILLCCTVLRLCMHSVHDVIIMMSLMFMPSACVHISVLSCFLSV